MNFFPDGPLLIPWLGRDPKSSHLSDLVKFSKLSCLTCLCGSITFSSFLILILVPIRHLKMPKMC